MITAEQRVTFSQLGAFGASEEGKEKQEESGSREKGKLGSRDVCSDFFF